MRDSRIGAYGAAALTLSLLLRVGALGALLEHSLGAAAAGMILAGAASRAAALAPLALFSPARVDGSGRRGRKARQRRRAARPDRRGHRLPAGLGVIGLRAGISPSGWRSRRLLAMSAIARRQIGGQTGDVAGAAQQLAEIACLCGLLIGRAGA